VNSLKTLAWVGLLLMCLLYVCAIFLTTQVGQNPDYKELRSYDGTIWPADVYFGTVLKSMFTLWQIVTLDGWCDGIVRHVSFRQPYLAVVFVVFILFTSYGLLNIVVGVIVENTLGAAQKNEDNIKATKERQRRKLLEHIKKLFELSDVDGSGILTAEEFRAAVKMPEVAEKLELIGLPIDEAEQLFELMDPTGRGEIAVQDFIASCLQLTGSSKKRDIMQVSLAVDNLMARMDDLDGKLGGVEAQMSTMHTQTVGFMKETLSVITGYDYSHLPDDLPPLQAPTSMD